MSMNTPAPKVYNHRLRKRVLLTRNLAISEKIDIDELPWPDREDLSFNHPLNTASMIGSRGCWHKCSFCSIAPFYKANGTPGRRMRNPKDVVDEMEMLYNSGAQVILFQDDDFIGGARSAKKPSVIGKRR